MSYVVMEHQAGPNLLFPRSRLAFRAARALEGSKGLQSQPMPAPAQTFPFVLAFDNQHQFELDGRDKAEAMEGQ